MHTFISYVTEARKGPYQRGDKIRYKYKGKIVAGTVKGVNAKDWNILMVDPGDGVLDDIPVKDVIKRLN